MAGEGTEGGDEEASPSQLLSNQEWVSHEASLFDSDKLSATLEPSEKDGEKADLLVKVLQERHMDHIK